MLERLSRYRRLIWAILIADAIIMTALAGIVLLPRQSSQLSSPQAAVGPAAVASAQSDTGVGGPTVGQAVPDFMLKTLDGSELRLSKVRGQPVLINFWASWCAPCRAETPELVRIYEARKADGLLILGVNMTAQDTLADVRAFATEFHVPFPILLDEDGAVAQNLYRLRGIPTSIFIDRTGMIVRRQIGISTGKQLDAFVDEMMR